MANVINDKQKTTYAVSTSGITYAGSTKVYDTIYKRDSDVHPGEFAWVRDATGDATVSKGSALYAHKLNKWIKIYETETMDSSIEIDPTIIANSHKHENKNILDKLSDSNGELQYNGQSIASEFEQVQSDWNTSNSESPSYIKNKPTTIALENVNGDKIGNNVSINGDVITLIFKQLTINDIDELNSRLTNIESDYTNIINRLVSVEQLESRISVLETNYTTISNNISNLDTKINGVQTDLTELINSLIDRITSDETDIAKNKNDIQTIFYLLTPINENITNLTNDLTIVKGNINTINVVELPGIKHRLDVLETNVDAIDLSGLEQRMTAAENNISTNAANITSNTNRISSLEFILDGVEEFLEGLM